MKLKCSACYSINQLNNQNYKNITDRSLNSILPLSDVAFKTNKNKVLNKGCLCFYKCGSSIKSAELGTIFYGIISLILHAISVFILINNLKQIVISMVVDLSLNIPNDISQYGLVNTEYKFILLNKTNQNNEPTREYIFSQFMMPIIFLSLSVLFALLFAMSTFFKVGNLANDDVNLGNDLILFDDHKKSYDFRTLNNLSYQFNHHNFHFKSPIYSSGQIEKDFNNPTYILKPIFQTNNKKNLSNLNNQSSNKINIIYEQDESDQNLIGASKSPSPTLTPPLSSPFVSSSSRSSSSPPLSTSSSSIANFSKTNDINKHLLNCSSYKNGLISKNSLRNDIECNNEAKTSYNTDKNKFISSYFNINNKKAYSSLFLSYLPATCSCFHLLMCFSLLLSRLYLNKLKMNYDMVHYNRSNNDKIAKILSSSNFSNSAFEDNLHFIYFFHENSNKTSKINTLFEEVNQSLKKILSPVSDIVNINLDSSSLIKNDYNSTTNFIDSLIDIGNMFHINLNYLNYLLAFLVFTYKSTRLYSTINRLFAFLVFLHLILFTCLNFTAFPAFEILFKSENIIGNSNNSRSQVQISSSKTGSALSTSTKISSAKMSNSTLNMPEYFSLNGDYYNNYSNDSIMITIPNSNLVLNMNLNINSFIPSLFNNEYFVLGTFLASWLFNLVYFVALNIFAISFYREAQLKTKLKYKNFLINDSTSSDCFSQNTNSTDIDEPISKKTDDFLHFSKSFVKNDNNFSYNVDQPNLNYRKIHKRASSSKNNISKKEQYQVINQYKAIIIGIFIFLVTETFRFPFVYSCYLKYFLRECNTFLVALMSQLVYLLFNALFWIILSFKTEWSVKFTQQFRILLWYQLYIEHLYKHRNCELLMKFNSVTNLRSDEMNRTSSTRVESDSKVSFDDASINSYLNLNCMQSHQKRSHSADCNINYNYETEHDSNYYRKQIPLVKLNRHSQSQTKCDNLSNDKKFRIKSSLNDSIFTIEHEKFKTSHQNKLNNQNYLTPLAREPDSSRHKYRNNNIESCNNSEHDQSFRKNELSAIEANNSNGYISVPTYSFTCQAMNENESGTNLFRKILNINQLSSQTNNQNKPHKKFNIDLDLSNRNSNQKLVDLKLKHLNAKNSYKAKIYLNDFNKELKKSNSNKSFNIENSKVTYSDLKKDFGKRDFISSRHSSVY